MSSSNTTQTVSGYPVIGSITENRRLQAQHNILVDALGSEVLCPVDLSKENFQALDVATADGYYLSTVRKLLKHPESAVLIGTDINAYPDSLSDLPPGAIKLEKHNFKEPWPTEWEGKFDFVQMRAATANMATFEEAVKVVQQLVKLLKPGGWIQLVDGHMPPGEFLPEDSPSTKMFKMLGNFLLGLGLSPIMGMKVQEIVAALEDVKNVEGKAGTTILGKGCAPGLEEDADVWFIGMSQAGVKAMGDQAEEYTRLVNEAMEEARTKGVELKWFAAWAQKA